MNTWDIRVVQFWSVNTCVAVLEVDTGENIPMNEVTVMAL